MDKFWIGTVVGVLLGALFMGHLLNSNLFTLSEGTYEKPLIIKIEKKYYKTTLVKKDVTYE